MGGGGGGGGEGLDVITGRKERYFSTFFIERSNGLVAARVAYALLH